MATNIVYADLDLGPRERCEEPRSPPEPGSPGCPRWHRVALRAGWTGNLLLGVAVVALGHSFLHRQPESPGSCKIGNGSVGGETSLRELREALCPSQSPGTERCRICPQGWTLGKAKCYWISTGYSPWSKSREDCGGRGATLLEPWDRDELESFNETLQRSRRNFWIGLWEPAAGTGWTWLNGSRLDRDRFQLDIGGKPGDCGMLSGRSISPQNCSSELQWICQREVTEL